MSARSDPTRRPPWEDGFYVEGDVLVRSVLPRSGVRYEHRCRRSCFEAVVAYVEAHAAQGITCDDLWRDLGDVPQTAAAVALAFLKERGCVTTRYRRSYPASTVLTEDAMCEFWALAEGR